MRWYHRFRPTRMAHSKERWLASAIGLLMLLTGGCSDPGQTTYPVVGTVTLTDGTPLAGGRITFQLEGNAAAPTAKAKIQPDGTFRLGTFAEEDGALEGTHRVLVRPPHPPRMRSWEMQKQMRRGTAAATYAPQIDTRYYGFNTSGLVYTVTQDSSKNRFEIQLEPPR